MGPIAVQHSGRDSNSRVEAAGWGTMRVEALTMDRMAALVEHPTELVLVLHPDEWTADQIDYLTELLARI